MPSVAARRNSPKLLPILALALALSSLAFIGTTRADAATNWSSECEALAAMTMPETASISAELVTSGEAEGEAGLPEFCRVALTVEPAINIEVWLPTDTYNGRFQAVGNGGFAGVLLYDRLAPALRGGYATAMTDTGHPGNSRDGTFALDEDGELNWGLIEDFASRSLFELTDKAKTLIKEFYGAPEEYSYWNSCSTGGRQGLMLAQRYPDAYDGVLAGAPAINWDRFIPAELWPQIVMQQELNGPIAQCKLDVATEAAVQKCDLYDGVADGVIDDPRRCDFDASTLIGQDTPCGTFTAADARAVQSIWSGAQASDGTPLWYGLAQGAPLSDLAGTTPFPIAEQHLRLWVHQDPGWDWRNLGYAGFEEDFRASQQMFNEVIGTDDPDLGTFQRAGGKVLLWHGWNDQLIFPEGTIDYYQRVLDAAQSRREAHSFARLFMAPGVGHCRGGVGPNQFDAFGALVDWVEGGKAPERIIASKIEDGEVTRTRPLCVYPRVARYDGSGDPNSADSFDCKSNYGR
jgi:pimeloyl-ACP methyl ester carboxylesterase